MLKKRYRFSIVNKKKHCFSFLFFCLYTFLFCLKTTFLDASPINPNDPKYAWMDKQIALDFKKVKPFTQADIDEALKQLKDVPCIHCYRIRNGHVFGPESKTRRFLEEITKRYPIPEAVIFYAIGDIVREDFFDYFKVDINIPIFSSAKSPTTEGKVIHFIDWYYDPAATDVGWNPMIKEIDSVQSSLPWKEKKSMLFWRGGTTDPHGQGTWCSKLSDFPRGILVLNSLNNPDLIDARFTWLSNPSIKKDFPTAPFVSITEHLKYKYQIAMDGETATYPGYQWRLYSGCLTLKQDSQETLWFYGPLKPWVHYVPVNRDLSDLLEKLTWLQEHDEEAERIGQQAREFVKENLMPEHMYIYGYKALMKYSSMRK